MTDMEWTPRSSVVHTQDLLPIAQQLEISPMLVLLLMHRGMDSEEKIIFFLNPGLKNLSPLHSWPGLVEAASLLAEGAFAKKTICVWGDYDVDGITSTVLVKDFFRQHGIDCLHYIPNRIHEGYGLNKESIDALAEKGVDVLLTVDSGISDIDAVAYAKSLGMTVIISDHHLPGEELPPADAIFNPQIGECPCPALAGVGVAFLLIAGVNAKFVEKGFARVDVRRFLDLVALGTLADVVNVCGENRILVKNGLLGIAEGQRPGVAALKAACNFSPSAALGAGQVVFSLAPRINAAGRLGSSETAVQLLLATDIKEATERAQELAVLNTQRRETEDSIYTEALEQAEQQVAEGAMGIVLAAQGWHPGVLGIVASRIVEKFSRPTVVLAAKNGCLKGSARSFGGFNLYDAFAALADILLGFGGHRMAAGLSFNADQLGSFKERYNSLVMEHFERDSYTKECLIDAELTLEQAADFTLLKELELLQPFGRGNAEPIFVSPPVLVKSILLRPNFCIVELTEEKSGVTLRAKGWRDLANFPQILRGAMVRIVFTPRIDRYNGVATVELRLKGWKRASEKIPFFPTVETTLE